jgi:hypothetical protein
MFGAIKDPPHPTSQLAKNLNSPPPAAVPPTIRCTKFPISDVVTNAPDAIHCYECSLQRMSLCVCFLAYREPSHAGHWFEFPQWHRSNFEVIAGLLRSSTPRRYASANDVEMTTRTEKQEAQVLAICLRSSCFAYDSSEIVSPDATYWNWPIHLCSIFLLVGTCPITTPEKFSL